MCGAGGSRTLVQTVKPHAFYMLISAFGFRVIPRPEPPSITLASKISSAVRDKPQTIPDTIAPLWSGSLKERALSDVSFPRLARE